LHRVSYRITPRYATANHDNSLAALLMTTTTRRNFHLLLFILQRLFFLFTFFYMAHFELGGLDCAILHICGGVSELGQLDTWWRPESSSVCSPSGEGRVEHLAWFLVFLAKEEDFGFHYSV
jgi:hypothetical protein